MAKPVLRLIHNLARSGGTLIGRCVGAMAGVALLSEIHPRGNKHFNPVRQAHEWYGLLTRDDIDWFDSDEPKSYPDAIRRIVTRAEERGDALVIRDWAHLD